jgi:hypothetical protein
MEKLGDSDMDNSDTAPFDLNQFGSWYLMAGIECYLESADMSCQCETLLLELDRLEAWEQQHGGYYGYEHVQEGFAELRQRITERLADIEAYDTQYYAERARSEFTVIEGGKKN